jgi:serine/threonine protein phosphatase PrpC
MEILADTGEPEMRLEAGDTLVLCTDGLWGMVLDEEIVTAVRAKTPAATCSALVELALQRGGPDNITVQVLRISD